MSQRLNLGDLEQEHEVAFQRREWRAGSGAWALVFAIMLGTAAGLFGSGALSEITLEAGGDALRVRSQRFARFGAALRLEIETIADQTGTAHIRIGDSYLQSMRVERIQPEPESTGQAGGALTFRFTGNDPGARTLVVFHLLPEERGWVDGRIGDATRYVDLSHLVYP